MFFSDRTIEGAENLWRRRLFRAVSVVTITALVWLSGPYDAAARMTFDTLHPRPKAHSALKEGLTQTPDDALLEKITARKKAQNNRPRPDFRPLTAAEKNHLSGRGPNRNKYFAGAPMPWHRSLRDVNLATGSLFKSFTDIQIAPAKGAGLVLQRTYSSQDEREGAFGVGWTHAYDIRMEEAAGETDPATGDEIVPRTDFFGGKHKYVRDADGLYTPPPYLFDEMDSRYNTALINGLPPSLEDFDKGMDGTVKHFILIGTKADGTNIRACDYIKDRHNNTTTLTYGASAVTMADGSSVKLLQSVADPSGRVLNFTWVNKGTTTPHWRITQVQGNSGATNTYTVTYEYETTSGNYQLWKVHLDSGGLDRVTTYTYTTAYGESGLLASISDALGHQVSYTYGNPASFPTGEIWVQTLTEPAGVTTGGAARTYTWTFSNGSDSRFSRSAFSVYVTGHSNTTTEPDLTFWTYMDSSYRTVYMLTSLVTPNMRFVWYYDNNNNVTRFDDASAYYSGGNGASYSLSTYCEYGYFGNVLEQYKGSSTNKQKRSVYTYYNASKFFQKASVQDPRGNISTFDYYGMTDGDTTSSNLGEVRWVHDANYGVTGKQYSYTYNAYGQKASETNLNGVVTTYAYGDSWGNLTQVKQDFGTGNNAQGVPYLNRTTTMTYDLYGRVLTATDPMNQQSVFTYNSLGQPNDAKFRDAASVLKETVTYGYGANGRTESVTDNRGQTTLAYENGSQRVSSVTDPVTGTISYAYQPSGEKDSVTLPDGTLYRYIYNTNLGGTGNYTSMPQPDPNSFGLNLSSIKMQLPGETTWRIVDINANPPAYGVYDSHLHSVRYNETYNTGGTLITYCEAVYGYDYDVNASATDNSGWLKQVTTSFKNTQTSSTTVLAQNAYTLNGAGQRTYNALSGSAVGGARTEQYGYDVLNRLNSVNYGDGETQGYQFDPMGNRASKSDTIGGATTTENYTYNNANMLLSRGSANYVNDTNGNTTTGGGRTNTWDTQNRLIQCVTGSGATQKTSAFTYGADGLRRTMNVQTGNVPATAQYSETKYVLDGQSVVQEQTRQKSGSGGTWTAWATVSYLMGPSGPLARIVATAADARWYCYDGLGSVLAEVDVNGGTTGTRKYDVYGGTRSYTGTPVGRQAFVGQLGHATDDETGLTYMRARYYDNVTGRFISEDTARDGGNWFAYCNGDPINQVDANGNVSEALVDIFIALMETAGLVIDASARGALLAVNAAEFGGLLFGGYWEELTYWKFDQNVIAARARGLRTEAEAAGLTALAAEMAKQEKTHFGRAIMCDVIKMMMPGLWGLAWVEEG